MRLVHELLVAALDERKAVPEEGFGFGQGRGTAVGTECRPYRRGGKLAVGVVGEGAGRVAVGDRHHLVEVAVGVALVALANETARRIVGVASGHAIGRRTDELVRVVEGEGGRDVIIGLRRARGARPTAAEDLLLEHVARLVVGVALEGVALRVLDREKLALPVVLVRLADAVRGAGDDLAGLRVFVDHRCVWIDLAAEVLAEKLAVLRVLVVDGSSVDHLARKAAAPVVRILYDRSEPCGRLDKASEAVVGAGLARDHLALAVLRLAPDAVTPRVVRVCCSETTKTTARTTLVCAAQTCAAFFAGGFARGS